MPHKVLQPLLKIVVLNHSNKRVFFDFHTVLCCFSHSAPFLCCLCGLYLSGFVKVCVLFFWVNILSVLSLYSTLMFFDFVGFILGVLCFIVLCSFLSEPGFSGFVDFQDCIGIHLMQHATRACCPAGACLLGWSMFYTPSAPLVLKTSIKREGIAD